VARSASPLEQVSSHKTSLDAWLTKCCPSYHQHAKRQTLSRLDVVDAAIGDDHGEEYEAELDTCELCTIQMRLSYLPEHSK
jgi:hypothetical protein